MLCWVLIPPCVSIQSGAIVPWRIYSQPSFSASPLTESRNRPLARTTRTFSEVGDIANLSLTRSGSPTRRKPVSIIIGSSLSPRASLATRVATVLSTPPDTAEITFLPWARSRSLAVSSDRKLDGWNPSTATDNRLPILSALGCGNLSLLSRPYQMTSDAVRIGGSSKKELGWNFKPYSFQSD